MEQTTTKILFTSKMEYLLHLPMPDVTSTRPRQLSLYENYRNSLTLSASVNSQLSGKLSNANLANQFAEDQNMCELLLGQY